MSHALARAPRGGAFIRQPYYHDPSHLHLGIWETPGDAELPGPVTVATAGPCAIYGCDNGDEQPVEQAALSLRLKPTRLYGRTLLARSETVAIPGLLDASRTRQVPVTACFERHERPLASDLGTLCSVLMRGLVWKTQAGKPRTVVTLGYRVPPRNPLAQAYPLTEKLDALEKFARDFARTRAGRRCSWPSMWATRSTSPSASAATSPPGTWASGSRAPPPSPPPTRSSGPNT